MMINHAQPGSNSMHVITLTIAISLLLPALAGAEYRRVELTILGMDCATCAHGVRVAVQKVEGVESVELSLERASADIRLRPANRASLDRFRQIVKANGFEPKQALVTAVGTVRQTGGTLTFDVSGVATALAISPDKSTPEAYRQLKTAAELKSDIPFEIVGTVEPRAAKAGDGIDTIAVTSVGTSR
jgi:copper chaperone CopZ